MKTPTLIYNPDLVPDDSLPIFVASTCDDCAYIQFSRFMVCAKCGGSELYPMADPVLLN